MTDHTFKQRMHNPKNMFTHQQYTYDSIDSKHSNDSIDSKHSVDSKNPNDSKHRRLKLSFLVSLVLAILWSSFGGAPRYLQAGAVENSYNYDYFDYELAAPDAFIPRKVLHGVELGIGDFRAPSDLFVSQQKRIYLADSGNDRIVVLDANLELVRVIEEFELDGEVQRFNQPSGLFVDHEENLYVADTNHGRIVKLDARGNYLTHYGAPQSELIAADFVYRPLKLTLDQAGRIYVIARNVNRGIIELDNDGAFQSFMGAIPVKVNAWDYVWKRISTEAQRAAMLQFVPTEYNNITMDEDGFLFVTSGTLTDQNQEPIRKLNLTGIDIMRRNGTQPVQGDVNVMYTGDAPTGPSIFVDVAVHDESHTFSALDRKRGRIFTYDEEGNLLHIFGNIGEQAGNFRSPTSLTYLDSDLLVTDAQTGSLTRLAPSPYAQEITAGLIAHNKGDYDEAQRHWKEVVRLNNHSEFAYFGLGRTLMRIDDFEGAMRSFKLANSRSFYSDAFRLALKDQVRDNFIPIVLGIIFSILTLVLIAKYKHLVLRPDIPVLGGLNYAFYVIFHPFDGFYDLKHEGRGNVASATVIYSLVALLTILERHFTGFVFNYYDPQRMNIISLVISTLLPYFIWVVANWALTTLMDGKGNMKDIYITTGYALFPQVLLGTALLVLSHVFSGEQASFYYLIASVAAIWVLALIFIGSMVTHDYTLGKNTLATAFTIVGMGLILFIGMLVFDLSSQMFNFVRSIAKEIQFRF